MLCVLAALGIMPATIAFACMPALPTRIWWCALVSGTLCGMYYFSLAKAYDSGEFTMVYPVARALPVLIVGVADMLRGRPPTVGGWCGMALVTAAILLLPFQSFRAFSAKDYLNRTTLWCLLTALGTVGYTVVDKFAAEAVHNDPAYAALYGYMFFFVAAVAYFVTLMLFGKPGENVASVGWKRPAIGGLLCFSAYWMILWAYQLAERAAYVLALRQFSILVGVAFGAIRFREGRAAIRIIAACVMAAGFVLIGLFG
jgi:drug/metabolite transporter (DMT)-like permease